MNAAAKVIHQGSLFHGQWVKLRLSHQFYLQIALVVCMLFSGLAVVYMTNLSRMTCSQLQYAKQQGHELEVQWGKLLLEQASLVTPARVEQLAIAKLHMVLPLRQKTYTLHSQ